jgi:putative polyhydroxyalkanoate system protein
VARITLERRHNLGRDAARGKAEQLAEQLAQAYDVRYHWSGDTLKFQRSGADGQIAVAEDRVQLQLNLGLLLSAMSGKITREIEAVLDRHLQA